MNPEDFELLLAMMRLLKRNDRSGNSVGAAIAEIIDSLGYMFTPQQKQAVSKEFSRYEMLLQERKRRKDVERKMEEEAYERALSGFFFEEAF